MDTGFAAGDTITRQPRNYAWPTQGSRILDEPFIALEPRLRDTPGQSAAGLAEMTAVAELALPLVRPYLGERIGDVIGLEGWQKQGSHAGGVDDRSTLRERNESGIARCVAPCAIAITDIPDGPSDPGQPAGQRRDG